MQKNTKIALGSAALIAVLAIGVRVAVADGQMDGWRHNGRMGMMGGGMMGSGMMNGQMDMMDGGRMGMMDGGMMGGGMMDGRMGMMAMMAMMSGPAQIDFQAADANKDGKLTADELTAWRATQVTSIDVNADGKLSADEIAQFMLAQVKPGIEAHAKNMVAHLDTDGDGLLSAAELLARPLVSPDFQRLDRNGDGAVTQDELSQRGPQKDAPQNGAPATPAPSGN